MRGNKGEKLMVKINSVKAVGREGEWETILGQVNTEMHALAHLCSAHTS